MVGVQVAVGLLRQDEGVAGGDEEAALPRPLEPAGQEVGQGPVMDGPVAVPVRRAEVVLEVVQEEDEGELAQDGAVQQIEAVRPLLVRAAEGHGDLPDRMILGHAGGLSHPQELLAHLLENCLGGRLAYRRDHPPAVGHQPG